MSTYRCEASPRKKWVLPVVLAAVVLVAVMLVLLLSIKPEELATGYVAGPDTTIEMLDKDGSVTGTLIRGRQITYVITDDEEADVIKIYPEEDTPAWLPAEHLVTDVTKVVTTPAVYVRTPVSLTDEKGVVPYEPVEQGSVLKVVGYAGLQTDGTVTSYQVQRKDGVGYIRADYVTMDQNSASAHYNEEIYQLHASRGDSWGGGDAAGLDYYPRKKGEFSAQGNTMPKEVRALYLNGGVLDALPSYLEIANNSGINAFVVDIVDGEAISYASPVMQKYSPSAYDDAISTLEEYRTAIKTLKDAGFYVIGRITVFNDANLAKDHPECVIANPSGSPMRIGGMYWPSAYNRYVWQYKTDLAVEAATEMGFNEIQFDYVRFPDGTWRYDEDEIDYRNLYGESKAQAVQRFLTYACDRLHELGVYVSADVFGECAEDYVCAYGQYWPAISSVVDVISGMPYPDHYNAQGSYLPWEHPYDTLYTFGSLAAERQKETASPAIVRTWIQCYNAIREPYNTYGPNEVYSEIKALRDTGNTGGYMTWNGGSSIPKYRSLMPAFNK